MKIIKHIVVLWAMLTVNCKPSNDGKQRKEAQRPNFVFLFADDQTFETISALGFDLGMGHMPIGLSWCWVI